MLLLDNLIKRFSATTKNFPASQVLESAIAKAYTDMSRRANGHTPKIQEESIAWLSNRFVEKSPFNCVNPSDFDEWHKETCDQYCQHMNSKGFSFTMTCGRAQKVLNMTFKYLYCTVAYQKDVEKILPFLHMTLDGYTLRWYKEVVIKYINCNLSKGLSKLRVGDVSDWSKMNQVDKHQYIDIQNRIREYLKNNNYYHYSINTAIIDEEILEKQKGNTINVNVQFDPQRKCPFYAEFIVWEGEIVRSKVENLFNGLNGIYKTWSDDKWAVNNEIKSELESKLNRVLSNI